jgi:hypothetical protein
MEKAENRQPDSAESGLGRWHDSLYGEKPEINVFCFVGNKIRFSSKKDIL